MHNGPLGVCVRITVLRCGSAMATEISGSAAIFVTEPQDCQPEIVSREQYQHLSKGSGARKRKRRAHSEAHRQGSSLPPLFGETALGARTVAVVSARGKVAGAMEAILIDRWASVRSMASSRTAALMPLPTDPPRPSSRRLFTGAGCASDCLSPVSRTHSAICSARSCTVSSTRCRGWCPRSGPEPRGRHDRREMHRARPCVCWCQFSARYPMQTTTCRSHPSGPPPRHGQPASPGAAPHTLPSAAG